MTILPTIYYIGGYLIVGDKFDELLGLVWVLDLGSDF